MILLAGQQTARKGHQGRNEEKWRVSEHPKVTRVALRQFFWAVGRELRQQKQKHCKSRAAAAAAAADDDDCDDDAGL